MSGFTFCRDFVWGMVSGMPDTVKRNLAVVLAGRIPPGLTSGSSATSDGLQDLPINIGTACSGSELYLSSLKRASKLMQRR